MRSIGSVVPAALVHLLRAAPLSDGKVSFAWRTAVGPAIGRATSVKLEQGVLTVEVASDEWKRAVAQASPMIVARLRAFLGDETIWRLEIKTRR
jgi:hypothetical protein